MMDAKLEEVSDLFLVDGPPLKQSEPIQIFYHLSYISSAFFVLFIFHIVKTFDWLLKRNNRSCYFNFLYYSFPI